MGDLDPADADQKCPMISRVASSMIIAAMNSDKSPLASPEISRQRARESSDEDDAMISQEHPSHKHGNYDWLVRRIQSGEAVALLSLSGNTAVAAIPCQVNKDVSYTVHGLCPASGGEQAALEPLTDPFEYTLLDVWGCAKGRVIALRPKAKPGSVYLAFRGVRVAGGDGESDANAKSDRDNLTRSEPVATPWLPCPQMRVHAGVLEHHESIWKTRFGMKMKGIASALKGSTKAKASATSDQEPHVCPLHQQLAQLQLQLHRWEREPIDELLFIGLSLGGALAELTAFRIALQLPEMRPLMRVVSFGSIAWATPAISDCFDETFGRRSVQLVLSRRVPPPDTNSQAMPPWWVSLAELRRPRSSWLKEKTGDVAPSNLRRSIGAWRQSSTEKPDGFAVFDPLVCAPLRDSSQSPDFFPLKNVLACNQDTAAIDSGATALMPQCRIAPKLLEDLMSDVLPKEHALMEDYKRLHLGAQYRTLLVSMLKRYRERKEQARASKLAANSSDERPTDEVTSIQFDDGKTYLLEGVVKFEPSVCDSPLSHSKLRGSMAIVLRKGSGRNLFGGNLDSAANWRQQRTVGTSPSPCNSQRPCTPNKFPTVQRRLSRASNRASSYAQELEAEMDELSMC